MGIAAASSVVRAGLESLLEESSQLSVVASESNVEDLFRDVAGALPDVVLVDLPNDAIESLRDMTGQATVILADDLEPLISTAIPAGIAILSRHATADQIRAATVAVASGLVVLESGQRDGRGSFPTSVSHPYETVSEPVTPRETEVLAMLAEGLGNKVIARKLGISEHTVKFHVGSIMRKLKASSRTEAVTTALRLGILTV